jgi:hypothetical protein
MQAHVELIRDIKPIEGYDRVEYAQVLGWWVIIKKDEFKVGDKVVYIEIDSRVPQDNPYFDFLEKRKYKVKTLKMCGVVSQGLVVPMELLNKDYSVGTDVSKELKITKIEDETREVIVKDWSARFYNKHKWFFKTKLGKYLRSKEWFTKLVKRFTKRKTKSKKFPNYIVKTDETRIQAIPQVLEKYRGTRMQVTEKVDGTSSTYGLRKINKKKFDFAVCSRNVRQLTYKQKTWYLDADTNYYWEMAFKYNIEEVLKDLFKVLEAKDYVYLQGETFGPSIQSNKYKKTERDIMFFNLVVDGKKMNSLEAQRYLFKYGMKWVPILDTNFLLDHTVDELLEYAKSRKSTLHDTLREGVVIRDAENTVSFKAINNDFLIKWNM